ncbi:MAG: type I 3-dehydroquinate dehydratase [Bilifractor sp.]
MWFFRRRRRQRTTETQGQNPVPAMKADAAGAAETTSDKISPDNTSSATAAEKPVEEKVADQVCQETVEQISREPAAAEPAAAEPAATEPAERNPSEQKNSGSEAESPDLATAERDSETEHTEKTAPEDAQNTVKNADPGQEDETEGREEETEGMASDSEEEGHAAHSRQKTLYTWHRDKHSHTGGHGGRPAGKVVLKNGVVIGEGVPKICVPITGTDREAVLAQAREVVLAEPDLAEWRADCFAGLQNREEMAELLIQLQDILGEIPLLFTCRTVREGGRGQLSAEDYRSLLLWAAGRPEISLVDVEGMNPEVNAGILISRIRELGMPVIASYHNFSRTPKKADLELIFQRLEQTGADILKVAVMPKKPKDVMRLMNVTAQVHADLPCPVITMSMGDMGKISRISGHITGSAVTFGTCGEASAPGQMPVTELKKLLAEF